MNRQQFRFYVQIFFNDTLIVLLKILFKKSSQEKTELEVKL